MATHSKNEAALLREAREGNGSAFEALINQHYGSLYFLVIKLTRNHEDAEDVLQDAILKAYSNLGGFRGESTFYTWLVRIALNQALMLLRKRRLERQVPLEEVSASEAEIPAATTPKSWQFNPEERYAEIELAEMLEEALKELSPRLYTVFVLQSARDLSAREIEQLLGLSGPAVKTRLRRARQQVRRRLSMFFPVGQTSSHKFTPQACPARH